MNSGYNAQMVVPITPVVKRLILLNSALWIGGVLLLQQFVFKQPLLFSWFGLIPERVINDFWIWQPLTYAFIHSSGVTHIVFNMLMLWWIGSELEARWGARFFTLYYLVCAAGAAVIYMFAILGYYFITNNYLPLTTPVVGASGAIFGLLLAYGLLFGERIIYFMMLFPMRAKYFVLIIGAMELVMLLDNGVSSQVANLAHLGGIAAGYAFLFGWGKWQGRKARDTHRRGRKLKLVVDNERVVGDDSPGDPKGPRYWN